MKPEMKFYYRGPIERYSISTRGYWVDGYSVDSEGGLPTYPWMGKRDCQKEAKAAGCRAVFIRDYNKLG
jgi:hypothetical protein